METPLSLCVNLSQGLVLILPMRNGNLPYLSEILRKHLGSYPTYEEWKLYGNFLHKIAYIIPFLSYL